LLAALFADGDAWCYIPARRLAEPDRAETPNALQLAGD